MGRWLAPVLIALAFAGAPAHAQEVEIPPPVLTIDQDRLFLETGLGAAASAEIEQQAAALAAENSRIEQELIARELELTEQRGSMDPTAFRELADAFDQRVQRIRAQQDDKAVALNRARDDARQRFFNDIAEVISAIVRERRALVVLDRRDVFLSADRIDITDEAIRRINATLSPDDQP